MRNGKARNLIAEDEEAEFARLARWDAEIEADFQRAVATNRAAGKAKRGHRLMGAPWAFWVALRAAKLPWLAVALAIYIYRRTRVTNSNAVTLIGAELDELGINRYQCSRALRRLVAAEVIRIEKRKRGRSRQVTFLLR
jgi:DNA-directed RNA polymerase subunit N (RpoN/RPB10)